MFKKIRPLILVAVAFFMLIPFNISVFSEEFSEGFSEEESENSEKYMRGDADCNGKISAADARLVLRFSAQLEVLTSVQMFAADYDKNNIVNSADARYILRVAAGLDPYNRTDETTVAPAGPPVSLPESSAPLNPIAFKLMKVPVKGQFPEFPTGCEMISAVMVFDYYGFDVTADEFADKYLSKGKAPYKSGGIWYSSDPDEVFLGDPRSESGWGIWAKGLSRSVNNYFAKNNINANASYTYSETLASLCDKYIDNDIPVIVWVTAYMEEPYKNVSPYIIGSNKNFTWISPNHCMVLTGYDLNGYYFNDPMTGKCEKYSKAESENAFAGNGSQALIIQIDK